MATLETNSSTEYRIDSSRRYRMTGWSLAIFFIGLLTTVLLFIYIHSTNQAITKNDFKSVTQGRIISLQKELTEVNDNVLAIQSFMGRDVAQQQLSHDFSFFVKQILDDEAHVRAVAWVMQNSFAGEETMQTANLHTGSGACKDMDNASSLYAFKLCNLVSLGHGESLLENGIVKNPPLVTALTQALQTGEMVASGSATAQHLTIEQKKHRFFIFPMSQSQQSKTNVKAGAVKPLEFLVIENYIPDLVETGLKLYTEGGGGVDIYLVDSFDDEHSQLLHFHPSRLREKPLEHSAIKIPDTNDSLVSTTTFQIGGQNW